MSRWWCIVIILLIWLLFHDPNLLHIILVCDWQQTRIYSQLKEVGTNLDAVLFEPFATFGPLCPAAQLLPTPPWCNCPAVRCPLTSVVLRNWLCFRICAHKLSTQVLERWILRRWGPKDIPAIYVKRAKDSFKKIKECRQISISHSGRVTCWWRPGSS